METEADTSLKWYRSNWSETKKSYFLGTALDHEFLQYWRSNIFSSPLGWSAKLSSKTQMVPQPLSSATFEWWTENHTFILLTTAAFIAKTINEHLGENGPCVRLVLRGCGRRSARRGIVASGIRVVENWEIVQQKKTLHRVHRVRRRILLEEEALTFGGHVTTHPVIKGCEDLSSCCVSCREPRAVDHRLRICENVQYPDKRLSTTLSKPDSAPPSIPKLPTALFEYSKLLSTPGQTLPLLVTRASPRPICPSNGTSLSVSL
jgi:hypothetical protein